MGVEEKEGEALGSEGDGLIGGVEEINGEEVEDRDFGL